MASKFITTCIKILVLLVAVATGKPFQKICAARERKTSWKIINGRDVNNDNSSHPHPHLVSIQWKASNLGYRHFCGGTILDSYTIVTASHCFSDHRPDCWGKRDSSCFRVVAGMYDLLAQPNPKREQVSEFSSKAIKFHENFNGTRLDYENDIALIFLNKPLNMSRHVRPIKLVDPNRPYRKMNATIAGWGVSDPMKTFYTPFLQEALVNIHSEDECSDHWGRWNVIRNEYNPETMICASGEFESDSYELVSDACIGDSGGPLIAKDEDEEKDVFYLVGLVSWGVGCGIRILPGVYTRVERYLDWIEENRELDMAMNRRERYGCHGNLMIIPEAESREEQD